MPEFKSRVITSLLLCGIYGTLVLAPAGLTTIAILYVTVYVLFVEWPALITPCGSWSIPITILYIIIPTDLMILFNQTEQGRIILAFTVLLVMLHDSAAHLIGSTVGRCPLAPTISPHKTIEGALGGWLTISAALLLYAAYTGKGTLVSIIILAMAISLSAICGDLFESYLKRRAGLKDSGTVLPGHGGLLDRFDALLFVVPMVYLFYKYAPGLFAVFSL